MADFIDINSLTGKAREIANDIDSRYVKDNKLIGLEVSVFLFDCHKNGIDEKKEPWYQQFQKIIDDTEASFKIRHHEIPEAARDATYVAPKVLPTIPTTSKPDNNKKNTIKNHPQYQQISSIVEGQLVSRMKDKNKKPYRSISELPKTQQEEYRKKVEYITKIVIEKCEKYNIKDLAPVIAEMLAIESGGYNFIPKVMVHGKNKHKGVMQVDFETCKSIYSEGEPKFSDWHRKHFSQDDDRIAELKAKYPTAQDLYTAIQKDVELGLEVGIITFKAKVHEANGSIAGGIKKYCGDQYKCNIPGVPKYFDVRKNVN